MISLYVRVDPIQASVLVPLSGSSWIHAYTWGVVFSSADGSLPTCLPIGLDPRACPAKCVQRAPVSGRLSGCRRDHPGIAGEDRPFLLSQTLSTQPAQVTVYREARSVPGPLAESGDQGDSLPSLSRNLPFQLRPKRGPLQNQNISTQLTQNSPLSRKGN